MSDMKLANIASTGDLLTSIEISRKITEGYTLALNQLKIMEDKIKQDAPKVEYFEALCESKDTQDIGTVSKILNMGIGRNKLFQILRDQKVLMEDKQPYQKYVDLGYFRIVETKYSKLDGSIHTGKKTVVFQTGINFIRTLLKRLEAKHE